MRLYIIRHADPIYETDTITEEGHLQAQALAEKLKKEGINKIFCSPLGRAKATMKYTAEALNIEPVILDWTQELSTMGCKDDRLKGIVPAWNLPGEIIYEKLPVLSHDNWHELEIIKDLDIPVVYNNLRKKSDEFIKTLGYERIDGRYKILQSNEDKVAVFCHGAFGRTWISQLLNIPLTVMWAGFWIPSSSVTTILFEERSKQWAVPRCIGFGDVSHLYHAGMQVSFSGIPGNFY